MILFLTEHNFKIRYRFKKFNFVDYLSQQLNYESEKNDKPYVFILQNKLRNIIILILRLTLMLTRKRSEITIKIRFFSSNKKKSRNSFRQIKRSQILKLAQ